MANMSQMQYLKNKKKVATGGTVSPEAYADLIFRQAFQAPFTALENDKPNMDFAYQIVDISAYLQEQICTAWGRLDSEQLKEDSDYKQSIAVELEKIKANEKDDLIIKAKIGYYKLSYLLNRIQDKKGKAEEFEV